MCIRDRLYSSDGSCHSDSSYGSAAVSFGGETAGGETEEQIGKAIVRENGS